MLRVLRSRWGEYVSCRELAEVLEVSKALVSRAVTALRRRGMPIAVDRRRGYLLVLEDDLSKVRSYIQVLEAVSSMRYEVVFYERCGRSSQDIAAEIARSGGVEGTVVLCESMEGGRGRLGRSWYAPSGGLWFTVVLRPRRIPMLHLLSLCAGIAVAEAINELLDVEVRLKWPNDVVYRGKKLCGILVEAEAEADVVKFVLVGIGINVNNELPKELREKAIALRDIVGMSIPRVPLLLAVLAKLANLYRDLAVGRYDDIISKWKALSDTLGKLVEVHMVGGGVVRGRAVDVDSYGRLVVVRDGERVVVDAGDVVHLQS